MNRGKDSSALPEIWPFGQCSDARKLLAFIEELLLSAIADPNVNTLELAEIIAKATPR